MVISVGNHVNVDQFLVLGKCAWFIVMIVMIVFSILGQFVIIGSS